VLRFEVNEVLRSRYKLLRQLGDGGFGIVWLADDTMLNRQVAIKRLKQTGVVLPDDSCFEQSLRNEILQEARKISRLNHNNIIQVYDVIEEEREALIVMEYAPEGSLQVQLKERARKGKWLETREAIDLLYGILSGLMAAHEHVSTDADARHGIIHSDLKPANILLAGAQPKLADFGLAAFGGVERIPTKAGQRPWHAGSQYFMSPEQLRGEELDQRSDLFNVGLIAFLLLGKHHPYADETLLFSYREMLLSPIRALPALQAHPRAAQAFGEWIRQLLKLNPEDRFPSARLASQELEECDNNWCVSVQQALEQTWQLREDGSRHGPSEHDLTPGEVVEAISLLRRARKYAEAVQLFEQGGFDLGSMPELVRQRVEEDYSICKRKVLPGTMKHEFQS
jgi:serine/threonine-protein kinase